MLLGKEVRFMVTHEAEITEKDNEHYLVLKLPDNCLYIPITQDLPKDVQKVFNQLIIALKKGIFAFSIAEMEGGDIFYHIAKEYISQLNSELKDVFKEMEDHGWLDSESTD